MNIFTLNVGQGQFVVVTSASQAFIVDTYVPLNPIHPIANVKASLATALAGKNLVGVMITGFDADHFNEVGLKIVLNKYRPDWIMYPKYFKKTQNATNCFSVIDAYDQCKAIRRVSISLSENNRRIYDQLSTDFRYEVFSPHADDMNSSNNCSLVCKVTDKFQGTSYLVTGDTENDRWSSINYYFGKSLPSDVLAAPHHGSENGISSETIRLVSPDTVVVSAGVDNQYGHPDTEAVNLYLRHSRECYATNTGAGQSLWTSAERGRIVTQLFDPR